MEVYAIICPKCRKQEFKYVDNKPTCQDCGYVLTDKNVEDILHQAYKESFTCHYCAEQLKEGHWKTMPDGKKICAKCFGKGMHHYEAFTDITKELLDSIGVGDLIKVNDWAKPLKVKGVSDNYFVMSTNQFGDCVYSVCEKKPWGGIRHNSMVGGMFHVGDDGWLFGAPVWIRYNTEGKYDFDNAEAVKAYLNTFELPEGDENHSFISPRRAVPIRTIFIKKAK